MKKFNTHGGYFAPLGYTRVNEGGSHEENPNGGVQLGVDSNGVPNMLEENEPVYDDFVFSDNIKADGKFLKTTGIPDKYTGKLYSEIADCLMEEAEERPLDAVSNNGIRAMLSRLAEAQEQQKQSESEKEIESELENLSPEELAQLEQMLAVEQENQIPQDQQVEPGFIGMACGGKIKRFDDGGAALVSYGGTIPAAQVTAYHPFTRAVIDSRDNFLRSAKSVFDSAKTPLYFVPGINTALLAGDAVESIAEGDAGGAALAAIPFMKPVKAAKGMLSAAGSTASSLLKKAGKGFVAANNFVPKSKVGKVIGGLVEPGGALLGKWSPTSVKGTAGKVAARALIDDAYYGGIGSIVNLYKSPFTNAEKQDVENTPEYTFDFSPLYDDNYACGGKVNKFDTGGIFRFAPTAVSAIKGLYNAFQEPDKYDVPAYTPSLPSGEIHLTDPTFVPLDTNMAVNNALASHAGTIRQLRNSGIGPSTGAAIVAADNNMSNSIGAAMTDVANTNNQMRNAVIGQRNANAQAVANFNYGLNTERARILNDAILRNQQNALLLKRLNNDAETQKYAAVGNELDSVAQGLYGIATENMRVNAANSMFDYVRLPDGRTAFVPKENVGKFGGTLLRKCR